MTITKADTSLILDTSRPGDLFCAYEHRATLTPGAPPEIIMVGACKLADAYRMIDGKTNSEWLRIFAQGGQVMVRIIATGNNRVEITRWAMGHMRSLPTIPRCNLYGLSMRGSARPVRCENTGEVYKSQRDACEQLGIQNSTMSRHLSGQVPKVNGMIFRYVDLGT